MTSPRLGDQARHPLLLYDHHRNLPLPIFLVPENYLPTILTNLIQTTTSVATVRKLALSPPVLDPRPNIAMLSIRLPVADPVPDPALDPHQDPVHDPAHDPVLEPVPYHLPPDRPQMLSSRSTKTSGYPEYPKVEVTTGRSADTPAAVALEARLHRGDRALSIGPG